MNSRIERRVASGWRFLLVAGLLAVCGDISTCRAEGEQPKPATASAKAAVNPRAATADEIQHWIAQLSDDAFTVRQASAAKLLEAGAPARDALVGIASGPDPEARAAAKRLVALIDRTEFNRRLEAFAADSDGKRNLTLPGWDRFREVVGDDAAARALFVDMQRSEGPLLATVFGVSSQPVEQLWEDRLTRLVSSQMMSGNRAIAPPLGSCAAIVFLGSVPEMAVSDRGAILIENLIQRPPLSEAIAAGGPQDSIRRLVSSWVRHCPNKTEAILARRLQLMSAINLKDGLPLALEVASGEKEYANVMPVTRAAAVLAVGQFGTAEHVAKLEPLLEDSTVCMPLQAAQPGQQVPSVQVRDVAMVVMLHLTGQRPSDYGYLHARLQPQQTFQIQTLHAANDQVRTDAVAKWKAWRETEEGRESRVEGREPDASGEGPGARGEEGRGSRVEGREPDGGGEDQGPDASEGKSDS